MESSRGMFVDGTEFDDLSALLERFTILRVSKQNDEFGDGSSDAEKSEPAVLYADIDGATVSIFNETSLFGAIARLVQAGLPLKFRTTISRSEVDSTSTSQPTAVKNKRTREDYVAMIDCNDECTGSLSLKSSQGEGYSTTHSKSRRRVCKDDDSCNENKSKEDLAPQPHSKAPYVGMSVSSDGLIVSKPDLFEHLLRGDKVLARVRDADGVVTTREL